jgi:small GTP-binding protein
LLNRFAKGTFNELSRATIGMEFVSREVDLSCAAPTLTENFHDVEEGFAASTTPSQATNSGYHSPAPESEPSPEDALADDEPSASSAALQHRRGLSMDLSLSGHSLGAGKRGGSGGSPMQTPGTPPPPAAPPTHFERIMLQLWDTAGQEINAALSAVYYRGARGVAVVYDVTRPETLYNVGRWVASARRHCDDSCVVCVIGNKTDLRHSVAVPEEEAREFCHSLGCRHYLASAMNGEGVEHAFLQLLLAVHAEATVRGVANELPNGVDIVRRVGGSRGTLTAVDSGATIAGFRLSKKEGKKKRIPCCGTGQ